MQEMSIQRIRDSDRVIDQHSSSIPKQYPNDRQIEPIEKEIARSIKVGESIDETLRFARRLSAREP
jgi:hypothetical protein